MCIYSVFFVFAISALNPNPLPPCASCSLVCRVRPSMHIKIKLGHEALCIPIPRSLHCFIPH